MEQKKYSIMVAANGRAGGYAKAKKQQPIVRAKHRTNAKRVFDFVLKNPNSNQNEIAEGLGLSQSFVSGVMFPSLKILRLQLLQGKTLSLSKQQIKAWEHELSQYLKYFFPHRYR